VSLKKDNTKALDLFLARNCEQDIQLAYKIWTSLVAKRYPDALVWLSLYYRHSILVKKNKQKEMLLIRAAAGMGSTYAKAICYSEGIGCEKNSIKAFTLYQECAINGDCRAICSLGFIFDVGDGVPEDKIMAVKLYIQSANLGYFVAMCNLGYCYLNGIGVPENATTAYAYYKIAADRGDSRALCSLGYCLENGKGVPKNIYSAVKYYTMAANVGSEHAYYNLAVIYTHGRDGIPRDPCLAAKYMKLAADASNNADAQYFIAFFYLHGHGINKNVDQAIYYYKLSVSQAYRYSQNELGECYLKGVGVEKKK